jgi:hypothetical protein
MRIKRSHVEVLDVDEYEYDNENKGPKYYCKSCEKYGQKVLLRNRIYPNGEPKPVDHESWKQCHECGLLVPVYELEKEASIKDVKEIIDNPFDLGKDSFLGIDRRTSTGGKIARKKRER